MKSKLIVALDVQSYRDAAALIQVMRDVVDMPNRHADLFVRLCLQNNGTLSKAKRQLPEFAKLTKKEIEELEVAVAEAFAVKVK